MKTVDNAVTYRDWSWIRWLNWPGWMWSSGFWDRFLQMRKHSRTIVCQIYFIKTCTRFSYLHFYICVHQTVTHRICNEGKSLKMLIGSSFIKLLDRSLQVTRACPTIK